MINTDNVHPHGLFLGGRLSCSPALTHLPSPDFPESSNMLGVSRPHSQALETFGSSQKDRQTETKKVAPSCGWESLVPKAGCCSETPLHTQLLRWQSLASCEVKGKKPSVGESVCTTAMWVCLALPSATPGKFLSATPSPAGLIRAVSPLMAKAKQSFSLTGKGEGVAHE